MNVGELLDQLAFMLEKAAITRDTPVLSDGCDCYGAARAVVIIQHRAEAATGLEDPSVAHLLVSREDDNGHGIGPRGIRVSDLQPPPERQSRTFTITDGKKGT